MVGQRSSLLKFIPIGHAVPRGMKYCPLFVYDVVINCLYHDHAPIDSLYNYMIYLIAYTHTLPDEGQLAKMLNCVMLI